MSEYLAESSPDRREARGKRLEEPFALSLPVQIALNLKAEIPGREKRLRLCMQLPSLRENPIKERQEGGRLMGEEGQRRNSRRRRRRELYSP